MNDTNETMLDDDQAPASEHGSAQKELAAIAAQRTADPAKYWSAETQARERELIAAIDGGNQAQAAAVAERPDLVAVEAELAAIARRRQEDRAGYFRDDKLQARERELIERREAIKAGVESASPEMKDLLAEWEQTGGIAHHTAILNATLNNAVAHLEGDEATTLVETFDALPEAVQAGIFRHLAVDGAVAARPASDAALDAFAETEEGAELVAEWGRHAPRRLGVLKSRVGSILKSMPAGERGQVERWLDDLSPSQAAAVFRTLARQ